MSVKPQPYRAHVLTDFLQELERQAENRAYLRLQRKELQERGDRAISHRSVPVRQKEKK